MKSIIVQKSCIFLLTVSLTIPSVVLAQMTDLDRSQPRMPEISPSRGGNRGDDPLNKLSPALRILYNQFSSSRGRGSAEDGVGGFSETQLSEIFGINAGDSDPLVALAVAFTEKSDMRSISKEGASTIAKVGNVAYVVVGLKKLGAVSNISDVTAIGILTAASTPPKPNEEKPRTFSIGRGGSATLPALSATAIGDRFNKKGLNGKGVIIGIIDTGIDWKHSDFIRENGTSRILAIWDLSDQSYQSSSVGSKPPFYIEKTKTWLGTLYTNEQINAALKGTGTVNSTDRLGHGTAVAGTAASNGRATDKGIPVGTYAGVAPEADLLVVKASDCGQFIPIAALTADWMNEIARSMRRPIVINMSFGGHMSDHAGQRDDEKFIDSLVGPGLSGRAVTIAAGNEGQYSLHSSGRFGPSRSGQADNFSHAIELFAKNPSLITASFDQRDDWGISFRSNNPIFRGADGKPTDVYLYKDKDAGAIGYTLERDLSDPDSFNKWLDTVARGFKPSDGTTSDRLDLQLPAGNYLFWALGVGPVVKNGRFDLYSVRYQDASFGVGTDKTGMVGSPGNAKNAITVGSYDFRDRWDNTAGETSFVNMIIGSASDYTNPGPRRDGVIKPDITSPARYTISSLSNSNEMDGGCSDSMASDYESITRDGYHIAWQGTSASAPFTAGVIALMFQKNPQLDAEQIRQILKKTARRGKNVGAVPNPSWGWGMIDPAAALAATPSLRRNSRARRKARN